MFEEKDTTTMGFSNKTYPFASFRALAAAFSFGSPMKACPFIRPSFIKRISNLEAKLRIGNYSYLNTLSYFTVQIRFSCFKLEKQQKWKQSLQAAIMSLETILPGRTT